jgi:hypothetical protein
MIKTQKKENIKEFLDCLLIGMEVVKVFVFIIAKFYFKMKIILSFI